MKKILIVIITLLSANLVASGNFTIGGVDTSDFIKISKRQTLIGDTKYIFEICIDGSTTDCDSLADEQGYTTKEVKEAFSIKKTDVFQTIGQDTILVGIIFWTGGYAGVTWLGTNAGAWAVGSTAGAVGAVSLPNVFDELNPAFHHRTATMLNNVLKNKSMTVKDFDKQRVDLEETLFSIH